MAKHKHVTFGGLGQHEFFLPTTGKGHTSRRDRKLCQFYCADAKYCSKIRNLCVGPTICHKFVAARDNSKPNTNKPVVGSIVYNEHRGAGKIVTISNDVCTIEFTSGKKVSAKYPNAFKNGTFKIIVK